MSAIAKTVHHHATVSLKLPIAPADLVIYAQNVVGKMTGNTAFSNPVPPLAAITAAASDLHAAQTVALTRAKGAAATRNEKRTALVQLLLHLKAYIQSQADANPENATSIIEGAGVALRSTRPRPARVFSAKPGALSGTAVIVAVAEGPRASYEWESSIDGGKTWTVLPPTMQAKTSVAGLQPLTTVQFRYRSVTKSGASDWSAPVSLVVQ
jgi:hypothetical protein